jgi:hypothetical protein
MTERDPDATRDATSGVRLVTGPTANSALATQLGYHVAGSAGIPSATRRSP